MVSYRFSVTSDYFEVHGVQLRETLRKSLKLFNDSIYGELRNDIEEDSVELILALPKDVRPSSIKKILGRGLLGNPIIQDLNFSLDEDGRPGSNQKSVPSLYSLNKQEIKKYVREREKDWKGRFKIRQSLLQDEKREKGIVATKRLKIIRDRANEPAWALRGAGKVFLISSKIQKELFDQTKEAHDKKTLGLLRALYYELMYNKDLIARIPAMDGNLTELEPSTECIRACIWNPPIRHPKMGAFAETLFKINEGSWREGGTEATTLIKQIEGLIRFIEDEVKGMGENI